MNNGLSSEKLQKRVIVYIDGFNLYEGLCEQGWRKYLWLNLETFSESLLTNGQKLAQVKYFTTRVSHPFEKRKRQSTFIDALGTLPKLRISYGRFKPDEKTCERCSAIVHYQTEKQTDVNIASEMLIDTFNKEFETAILVSGDSDLVAPVKYIRSLSDGRSIVVAFPPKRESYELESVATAAYRIVKKKFRDNQFPETVVLSKTISLKKPQEWA